MLTIFTFSLQIFVIENKRNTEGVHVPVTNILYIFVFTFRQISFMYFLRTIFIPTYYINKLIID